MVELGFSLQAQYACPLSRVIETLHEAGFSAISPVWSPELPLDTIAKCSARQHMAIQSLHAPHGNLAALWDHTHPASGIAQQRLMDCIDACSRYRIPLTVIHGWQGLEYVFPDDPLDFSVFDRIVDYAGQRQVAIAFENLEGEEYLEALLHRYRDRNYVGYCWDSGHDHCYPHKTDFLAAYGDRLIMTHIHDNRGLRDPDGIPSGNDDLHFLPYDGNICWEQALARLQNLPPQKILNFELKKRSASFAPEDLIYDNLSPEEFFRLAGRRARQIANLYQKMIETKKA